MAKSENQKLKLLVLKDYFEWETDRDHPVTVKDIISHLSRHDIAAERKSIYSDIEALNEYFRKSAKNKEIVTVKKNRECGYYLNESRFSDSELSMIGNAVSSAKFLSETKVKNLLEKISLFGTRHQESNLKRKITVKGRVRTTQEGNLDNLNQLTNAINSNRQISFSYYSWTEAKKLELREDGKKTAVSPWHLVWDNEYYYLVAYDGIQKGTRHYRIDKMKDIRILSAPREGGEELSEEKDYMFSNRYFGMYHGTLTKVTFLCTRGMLNVLLDRFGTEVFIFPSKEAPGKYEVKTEVSVSKMFLGWVMGLGSGIRIISPQSVVDKVAALAAENVRDSARSENGVALRPVKNIIFDIGNVLVDFRYMDYMRNDLGFPEEIVNFFGEKIVLSKEWLLMDEGARTEEENCKRWKEQYPDKAKYFDRFFKDARELVRTYPDSVNWIKSYKDRGYGIYLLTNYPEMLFNLHRQETFTFMNLVDGYICSAEVKQVKPNPEIYRTLFDKYQLNASECVFVDDNRKNIDGAEQVGMHGILAEKRAEARDELEGFLLANGAYH